MDLGIYKQGQGYWVRVLTAVCAGLLTLAVGAWAWSQADIIAEALPKPTWRLTLNRGDIPPVEGSRIELVGTPLPGEEAPVIGDASVVSITSGTGVIIIGDIQRAEGHRLDEFNQIRSAGGESGPIRVQSKQGIPVLERTYVKGGIAGAIVLVGTFLIYWFVGQNKRTVDFLIHTDGEMKKVNWSTRRDVIGSTWVVVAASVLLAMGLFGVDLIFSTFFEAVGLLQRTN